MKKLIRLFAILVAVLAIAFISLLALASVTDYKPEKKEHIYTCTNPQLVAAADTLSFLLWNIGYCGLNAEMDFFYDGGTQVRPSEQTVTDNLSKVKQYILAQQDVSFFLFQELDRASKRSYFFDIYADVANALVDYNATFAKNYDVVHVPSPLLDPMGRVLAGLATFSKERPSSSIRYSYPGNFSWPMSLFMLDRCFLVNKYQLEGSKGQLVVVNSHNSAYDDGQLRSAQLEQLKGFLLEEYNAGNYVVVGADWNQCPPNLVPNFMGDVFDAENVMRIPEGLMPKGWQWAFDSSTPSNRRIADPYQAGTCPTTVIDYYLVSPNVELLTVKTAHLGFKVSDHNPVKLSIKLKP